MKLPSLSELWRQRKSRKYLSCCKVELTPRGHDGQVPHSFALSLLDRGCSAGVHGPTPSMHEVLRDSRHFL